METGLSANGWGAMETANCKGLFNLCGDKEGSFSVAYDKWKVMVFSYHELGT